MDAPAFRLPDFGLQHLLGIEGVSPADLVALLDRADEMVEVSKRSDKSRNTLVGRTLINLFYENSTRTSSSLEIAGKRVGMDVVNMAVATSSVKKGETLLDTAATLNAMNPDLLVMRHNAAGAAALLAQKVECAVINAGDGAHDLPTQALLSALTIRRKKGSIAGLVVAICGDIVHSRVARSNIHLLNALGAQVRVIGPSTLCPGSLEDLGVTVFRSMEKGLPGCDVVMMLRLQTERMAGAFIPSAREFYRYFGLNEKRVTLAKKDAIVMHPGPMNRGVEIASTIADGVQSVIVEQVEMGVAVSMAVMEMLAEAREGAAT